MGLVEAESEQFTRQSVAVAVERLLDESAILQPLNHAATPARRPARALDDRRRRHRFRFACQQFENIQPFFQCRGAIAPAAGFLGRVAAGVSVCRIWSFLYPQNRTSTVPGMMTVTACATRSYSIVASDPTDYADGDRRPAWR